MGRQQYHRRLRSHVSEEGWEPEGQQSPEQPASPIAKRLRDRSSRNTSHQPTYEYESWRASPEPATRKPVKKTKPSKREASPALCLPSYYMDKSTEEFTASLERQLAGLQSPIGAVGPFPSRNNESSDRDKSFEVDSEPESDTEVSELEAGFMETETEVCWFCGLEVGSDGLPFPAHWETHRGIPPETDYERRLRSQPTWIDSIDLGCRKCGLMGLKGPFDLNEHNLKKHFPPVTCCYGVFITSQAYIRHQYRAHQTIEIL